MEPCPLSTVSLTKDDFEHYRWQDCIASASCKRCTSYAGCFLNKAAEAKASDDLKAYSLFTLLGDITYPVLQWQNKETPFLPAHILPEISEQHLAVLAEIVTSVSDPTMRARIADVLWLRKKAPYPIMQCAIEAYLEIAHREENPDNWIEWITALTRAFRLAATIDQKRKGLFATVIAYVEELLERYQEDSGLLLSGLLELLQEHRIGDTAKYIALTQQVIIRVEVRHLWHAARIYWAILARWFALEHNDEQEKLARIALAETYVREAEDALRRPQPSYMVASTHLESAIQALRTVGDVAERIQPLRKLLLNYQRKSVKEYKRIEMPIDDAVTDTMVRLAKQRMTYAMLPGKQSLRMTLFKFAFLEPAPQLHEVRKQVEETARIAPLQYLLSSQLVDASGKTKDSSTSPLSSEQEEQDIHLRQQMFAWARQLQSINALMIIEPAREQVIADHPIEASHLLPFLTQNPFIPSGREALYARGLVAGFSGDFLVSTHLLIPQVENSLRNLVAQQGHFVSGLTAQGIQDEYSLNKLYDEHRDVLNSLLGEDIVFDVEGLLIERFGTNLRNDVSHGLLDMDRFGPGQASYFWWLTLKLCIYFWLIGEDEAEQSPERVSMVNQHDAN